MNIQIIKSDLAFYLMDYRSNKLPFIRKVPTDKF